jgi:plastocyanin
MKPVRPLLPLLAAVTLVAVIAIASCSKSSSPYNPGGGGGGGGGGGAELNSGNIPGGGVFKHTFATAGAFPYHCAIHGLAMAGTVNVNAGSANDSILVTVGSGGNVYSPATVDVKPGGYVRWINAGVTHTVTSN